MSLAECICFCRLVAYKHNFCSNSYIIYSIFIFKIWRENLWKVMNATIQNTILCQSYAIPIAVEVEYLYNLSIYLSVFHHIPGVDYGGSRIRTPRCPPPQPHIIKLVLYLCVTYSGPAVQYMTSVYDIIRYHLLIHLRNSRQI